MIRYTYDLYAALQTCAEHAEGSDGRSVSARLFAISEAARSALARVEGKDGAA